MAAKKERNPTQSKSNQKKSNRGGSRSNAGRKPTATVQAQRDLNSAVDALIGAEVPKILANLFRLANGGYERVTVTEERDPVTNEMVETKRVVEVADADRAANEYLLNRRLGKPKQAVEVSGPDGAPISVSIESAIEKLYGSSEDES